jgi:hypothetical protein
VVLEDGELEAEPEREQYISLLFESDDSCEATLRQIIVGLWRDVVVADGFSLRCWVALPTRKG